MQIEINLLPPHKKEELRMAERFSAVLRWEGVVFSILIIFLGFIFGIDYLLNLKLELIDKSRASEKGSQYEKIKQYENKFSEINSQLTKLSDVTSGQLYWSEFFLRFNQATPENIEISGVSNNDFAVFIAGKAKTREDLLLFKDHLAEVDCFEAINLPLADLVSKEDVAFQIDLKVKENCLKK